MRKVKMITKRVVATALTGILLASCFVGCGKTETSPVESTETEKVETEEKAESTEKELITTEPVTLKILTQREAHVATDNTQDLYIWKLLEEHMASLGYDVTLEVEAMGDPTQQIPMLLGTGELPDIVWYSALSNNDAVIYGAGEGMILDWVPYLSDPEIMPNANYAYENYTTAFNESTCVDGGIYALPYLDDRCWLWGAGSNAGPGYIWWNQDWLDECGLEVPTTMDEVLDTLRAFKNVTPEGGGKSTPFIASQKGLEKVLWTCLGYYGGGDSTGDQFGSEFWIKDGEAQLPAATEDYKTFVEILHTMYSEGLISADYFTMDNQTAQGLVSSGMAGATTDGLNKVATTTFDKWLPNGPIAAGDNDEVITAVGSPYNQGRLWASADTEYPELVAMMVDYIFAADNYEMMKYGPMQGEDPYGMVDGWYVREDGWLTNDGIEAGTYANIDYYGQTFMYPHAKIGCSIGASADIRNADGSGVPFEYATYTDAVTGKEVEVVKKTAYDLTNADGYGRIKPSELFTDTGHVTTVRLPGAYVAEDSIVRADELKQLLTDHITTETVNFVTGVRPLSEIDKFQEELKELGSEEYIEIYRAAYASYLDSIF